MGYTSTDLHWIIKPKYQEIIVYGQNSFVAKINDTYKILDYNEKVLHEFTNKEILGIKDHPNEGGELQEIIHVNYQGNKSRLYNIKSLNYLHDKKYYLLQTEDYYEPERRLIRVFDNLKEGVMDFDGNLLLPPIYEGVSVTNEYCIGFSQNEISVFYNNGKPSQSISYTRLRPQHIAERQMILIHRSVDGKPNIYREVIKRNDGITRVIYEETESPRIMSGIIDIEGNEVIPFNYSSLSIKKNDWIEFTKNEIVTENGVAISKFNPKRGVIDFDNNVILENKYKYIGVVEGGLTQVENFENKRAVYNLVKKKFETDFIFNNYEEVAIKLAEFDKTNKFLKFEENGFVGMKDKLGTTIIPAKYRGYHKTMDPSIFIVYGASDDESGYEGYYHIDLNKEIVPTLFADRGGIGGHKRNNQNDVIKTMDPETGKIGFYRTDGFKIADPIYDDSVDGFSENLAPVYEVYSEKTGMIDIEGKLIYDYIFDTMTLPYDNKSIVSYKGKFGILQLSQ